ncbi:MAG TPA: serine--tRNA ligase, partial [Longimicrobium sp.]|nr:serine--tRNA ligase [Longimicrobium sp.]
MLDLRLIRQEGDAVRAALARRGDGAGTGAALERVATLDAERRALIAEGDELKARRNAVSQEVAERKRRKEEADDLIAETRAVGERIKAVDARLREVEGAIDDVLLRVPNLPDASVPEGGEEANAVVRTWGEKPSFSFTPRPHWEIGTALG